MAYQRQTRKTHPILAEAPELPRGAEVLWADFLELHRRRGFIGMDGRPAPLTYHDIEAFQRVREVRLEAWEIDSVFAADAAFFEARAKAA